MKHKDVEELRNKSREELEAILKNNRERLRSLRFDLAAGKMKNMNELRNMKKAVAVILTFLNQKQK